MCVKHTTQWDQEGGHFRDKEALNHGDNNTLKPLIAIMMTGALCHTKQMDEKERERERERYRKRGREGERQCV